MTIDSGIPLTPTTVEEWMEYFNRRLSEAEAGARGAGRTGWNDAEVPAGLSVDAPGEPAWRRLNDGRIELRGRVVATSGTIRNGDVVLVLPLDCAPPSNDTIHSSVSFLAPCASTGDNPGVVRLDVTRVAGDVVHVIARPPVNTPLTGWLGLDHAAYDPHLYLDVLPPVPFGEQPLVADPGIAFLQFPSGEVVRVTPGVEPEPPLPNPDIPGEPEPDPDALSNGGP